MIHVEFRMDLAVDHQTSAITELLDPGTPHRETMLRLWIAGNHRITGNPLGDRLRWMLPVLLRVNGPLETGSSSSPTERLSYQFNEAALYLAMSTAVPGLPAVRGSKLTALDLPRGSGCHLGYCPWDTRCWYGPAVSFQEGI